MGRVGHYAALWRGRVQARLLKNNQNWICVIAGQTGSGKSYSALSLADQLSARPISVARNVVFNATELMELINNPEGLKKGDIVIFDEAGVGAGNRDWMTKQNKIFGSILQTFRNLNLGLILTVPNLSFIDVQIRKLNHCYMETYNIDRKKSVAYLRVYDIQHNSRMDRTYYKNPVFLDAHGAPISTRFLAVPKARPELLAEYEERKTRFTKELNEQAAADLKGENTPKKSQSDIYREKRESVVSAVSADVRPYVKEWRGRKVLDARKVAKDFGISTLRAYQSHMP